MYCTNCGTELSGQSKFCTSCGASASPNFGAHNQASSNTQNNQPTKQGIELSKVFLIISCVLVGILVIGGVVLGLSGAGGADDSLGSLFATLINWLLSIVFIFALLGLLIGIVLGAIFLSKSKEGSPKQAYYKRNAVWAFVAPILIIIEVVVIYVIVQIIYRFAGS